MDSSPLFNSLFTFYQKAGVRPLPLPRLNELSTVESNYRLHTFSNFLRSLLSVQIIFFNLCKSFSRSVQIIFFNLCKLFSRSVQIIFFNLCKSFSRSVQIIFLTPVQMLISTHCFHQHSVQRHSNIPHRQH